MKGDITVGTLGIIVIIAATIFMFFVVFPGVLELILKEFALYSASVVSKELAGYITISGAAPHSISISYYPSNLPYNVEIKNRVVRVSLSEKAEGILERTPGVSSIPIDPEASFEDVNSFFITKSQNRYEVEAEWIERVG